MKFLFIGPGYPGVTGASRGSGIGTYLREITLGLKEREHECHVVVWGGESADLRPQTIDHRPENPNRKEDSGLLRSKVNGLKSKVNPPRPQIVDGVPVYLLKHSYWPIVERLMPDSRDVWNMRQLVKLLDAKYHYDWIEIQSEEGIGIGVQKAFPDKTILRAHTTLLQMVHYKGEKPTNKREAPGCRDSSEPLNNKRETHGGRTSCEPRTSNVQGSKYSSVTLPESAGHAPHPTPGSHEVRPPKERALKVAVRSAMLWCKLCYRLSRERRSFQIARRIMTHSKAHAQEMKRLYPGIVEPMMVWHGIGGGAVPCSDRPMWVHGMDCRRTECASHIEETVFQQPPMVLPNNSKPITSNRGEAAPSFLIIGTPDRRKGFDRIRPVLEAYAAKYGPCRVVIVTPANPSPFFRNLLINSSDAFLLNVGGAVPCRDRSIGAPEMNSRRTECASHIEDTPVFQQTVGGAGGSSQITVEWKSGLSSEELTSEFADATVYLHLARYESFGIPLIEAASHGVPIVSTRVGIASELLDSELEDYLVDGDDPESCAQILGQAVLKRESLSTLLLQRFSERFTRARMVKDFVNMLER